MEFFKPPKGELKIAPFTQIGRIKLPVHYNHKGKPYLCYRDNSCPICQIFDSFLLIQEFKESNKGFWVDHE
jgi:hypothetical protein